MARLPVVAPNAYSVSISIKVRPYRSKSKLMDDVVHCIMQSPHPAHSSRLMRETPSSSVMAPRGQTSTHTPHATQPASSTIGSIPLCWSIFPTLGAHPIPRFFIAPPNPASPCPLKCDITIMLGAERMPPAIFTVSYTHLRAHETDSYL